MGFYPTLCYAAWARYIAAGRTVELLKEPPSWDSSAHGCVFQPLLDPLFQFIGFLVDVCGRRFFDAVHLWVSAIGL